MIINAKNIVWTCLDILYLELPAPHEPYHPSAPSFKIILRVQNVFRHNT